MHKKLKLLAVITIVCAVLCSCGTEKSSARNLKKFETPTSIRIADSAVVAENDDFSLSWDKESVLISLTDKRNGSVWSTTPVDFEQTSAQSNSYQLNGIASMLYLTYVNSADGAQQTAYSYRDCSYIGSSLIEDGIRLTFYFIDLEISVSVNFTIQKDGLKVSVPVNKITENENQVYMISLLPFFASAKNNTDSYLFVPSGNGALMNVDDNLRDLRNYSEAVYGTDAIQQNLYMNTKTETVRMPVIGVKSEDKGMIGIATEGSELATVNATAGDQQYGYSAAYFSFQIRGYFTDVVNATGGTNVIVNKCSDVTSGVSDVAVLYKPLNGDVSYNGMASSYRDYLKTVANNSTELSNAAAIINFLGGEEVKASFFGVPYNEKEVATDFEDVQSILKDIKDNTGTDIVARLTGFGASGLDFGEFASGISPDNAYGGKKGFKSLQKWCDDNQISLFPDADVVFYNKSGNGASVRKAATTVNDTRAKWYLRKLSTGERDTDKAYAYLINRYDLVRSGSKIKSMLKKIDANAVSLSTLSNTAYSDYRQGVYYAKSNMGVDVQYIYNYLQKSGYKIMSDSANDYAAVVSDFVYNAPSTSSQLDIFDTEIPFYYMAFRGLTTLSGPPINLSSDMRSNFLTSISYGSLLSFTLTANHNERFITGDYPELAFSVYDDLKDTVCDYISSAKTVLDRLENAEIVSYIKQNDVSETKFSNGTTLYVNFGSTEAVTPAGVVEAYSYIFC